MRIERPLVLSLLAAGATPPLDAPVRTRPSRLSATDLRTMSAR